MDGGGGTQRSGKPQVGLSPDTDPKMASPTQEGGAGNALHAEGGGGAGGRARAAAPPRATGHSTPAESLEARLVELETREAGTGVQFAAIYERIGETSAQIREVMDSIKVVVDGVKAIRGIAEAAAAKAEEAIATANAAAFTRAGSVNDGDAVSVAESATTAMSQTQRTVFYVQSWTSLQSAEAGENPGVSGIDATEKDRRSLAPVGVGSGVTTVNGRPDPASCVRVLAALEAHVRAKETLPFRTLGCCYASG